MNPSFISYNSYKDYNTSAYHFAAESQQWEKTAKALSFLHNNDIVIALPPLWIRQLTIGLSSVLATDNVHLQFTPNGLCFSYFNQPTSEFAQFTTLYQGFEFLGTKLLDSYLQQLQDPNCDIDEQNNEHTIFYFLNKNGKNLNNNTHHTKRTVPSFHSKTCTLRQINEEKAIVSLINDTPSLKRVYSIQSQALQDAIKSKGANTLYLCFSTINNSSTLTLHIDTVRNPWIRSIVPCLDLPDSKRITDEFDNLTKFEKNSCFLSENPYSSSVQKSDFVPFPTDIFLQLNISDIRTIQQNVIKPTRGNGDSLSLQFKPADTFIPTLANALSGGKSQVQLAQLEELRTVLNSRGKDFETAQVPPYAFVHWAEKALKLYRRYLCLQRGFLLNQVPAFTTYRGELIDKLNQHNQTDSQLSQQRGGNFGEFNALPSFLKKHLCVFFKTPKLQHKSKKKIKNAFLFDSLLSSSLSSSLSSPDQLNPLQFITPADVLNTTSINEPTLDPPLQLTLSAQLITDTTRTKKRHTNHPNRHKQLKLSQRRIPSVVKFHYDRLRKYCWSFYEFYNTISQNEVFEYQQVKNDPYKYYDANRPSVPSAISLPSFQHAFPQQGSQYSDISTSHLHKDTDLVPPSQLSNGVNQRNDAISTPLVNYIPHFYRLFGNSIQIRSQALEFAAQIAMVSGSVQGFESDWVIQDVTFLPVSMYKPRGVQFYEKEFNSDTNLNTQMGNNNKNGAKKALFG
jgi:hypothetical protein